MTSRFLLAAVVGQAASLSFRGMFFALILAIMCLAAPSAREPHIGYLYPAGGQQGRVVRIIAGGQFLKDVSSVYLSGDGVRASIIEYAPPLNSQQMQEFQQYIRELAQKRIATLPEGARQFARTNRAFNGPPAVSNGPPAISNAPPAKLPDYPLLRGRPAVVARSGRSSVSESVQSETRAKCRSPNSS